MKRTKLILTAILLVAAVGAYASSHNLAVRNAYVIDGNACVFVEEVACEIGDPTCEVFYNGDFVQAYATPIADPVSGAPCQDELELE